MDVTKPFQFIGFGDINGPKPYDFIGFGAMDVTKPYKFIGFGDINGPKPGILIFQVFGRFSAKLGPKTPLERRGSSCSAGCTKH